MTFGNFMTSMIVLCALAICCICFAAGRGTQRIDVQWDCDNYGKTLLGNTEAPTWYLCAKAPQSKKP